MGGSGYLGKNTIGMNVYKKDDLIVYVTPETLKELFVAASFIWVLISMFCLIHGPKRQQSHTYPNQSRDHPAQPQGVQGQK